MGFVAFVIMIFSAPLIVHYFFGIDFWLGIVISIPIALIIGLPFESYKKDEVEHIMSIEKTDKSTLQMKKSRKFKLVR